MAYYSTVEKAVICSSETSLYEKFDVITQILLFTVTALERQSHDKEIFPLDSPHAPH